jgi:Protein of unknown function (DUF3097)
VSDDRYGNDILANDPYAKRARVIPEVVGELGLVLECADSGWCGAIVGWEKSIEGWSVLLEDRDARVRMFPAGAGAFLIDGERTTVTRPTGSSPVAATRTASGSRAVAGTRARVARGSRIWVEGKHDAELIEKVWGDDLRIEGVVVEMLDGVDNLPDMLAEFSPDAGRRVGVLVDHRVEGSKESRIASDVMVKYPQTVLVVGHPFVDVWQAITPAAAGIDQWPAIARGTDWKTGICTELGWPDDTGLAWKQLLSRVTKWTDLDHQMLGPVEQLIDFVTETDG